MSAKSKTRSKDKRKKEKQKRKAQKVALFLSFKDQGRNKKSKRFVRGQKGTLASRIKHPTTPCGNNGCKNCYGVSYAGFVNKNNVPKGMPAWMFSMWKEDNASKRKE